MKVFLSPEEFADELRDRSPPDRIEATPRVIRRWAAQGRIPGAHQQVFKRRPYWCIPADAEVLSPEELRKRRGVMSVTEYAALHGRSRQRVHQLIDQGLIAAQASPSGAGSTYEIDANLPWPDPREAGRPHKEKANE